MLCGDVHISVCHQKPYMLRKDRRDLTVQVYRDEKIAEKARKLLQEEHQSGKWFGFEFGVWEGGWLLGSIRVSGHVPRVPRVPGHPRVPRYPE